MTMEENEPLSSDEETSVKKITLEHVVEECGSFGRYQYIHFFFLTFLPIASGLVNFYYVFGAAETPYKCQVSAEHHPIQTKIEILPSQCFYQMKDHMNETIGIYSCTEWIYDRSVFGETFAEEANLICRHSLRRSLLATMLQMGAMLIFFTGQIADVVGRRRSIQLLVALLVITSVVTQGLLQFVPMTVNQKLGIMLINQFISGIDSFIVAFLLLIELTTSAHTTFVGNLAMVTFTLGEVIIAGMAYLCRHWLLLKWAMTLYFLAIIPYLIFLPESPHWLLTKHRYDELEKLLRQIARWNRRSESRWLPFYRLMIENHRKEKDIHRKNLIRLSLSAKIYRFITHVPTMSRLFISAYLGFVTLLLYIKISYYLAAMNDVDPYINIIIGAFVEALGYIASALLMMRYGRKPVLILFLIPTVLCLLLTPFTFNQNRFILIIIAQFGKFAISGAVCVTYIMVPELFPTTIRGTAMGFFVLFSRFGSTAAPMIDAMINHNQSSVTTMYYLYTLLTALCAVLTLLLPETRNVPLTDKIDYNAKTSMNLQTITRT